MRITVLDEIRRHGMLVLSRSRGEAIRFGTDPGPYIWVTVLEVQRGHVRLGIAADRDVLIMRSELLKEDAPDGE